MISHGNRLGSGEKLRFSKIRGTITYSQLPTGSGSWDTGAGTTITIPRALTVSGLLTANAHAAVVVASQPVLTIEGTAVNASDMRIAFKRSGAPAQEWSFGLSIGAIDQDLVWRDVTGSANKMRLSTTALSPATAGGLTLGTAALPWGAGWFNGLLTASAGATMGGRLGFNSDASNYHIDGISDGLLYAPYSIGNFTFVAGAGTWAFTNGVVNISGLLTASAGATVTGAKTTLAATVAGYASVNLPHGTAPSAPVDGDMWTTTAGLFVRVNGSTVGPLS